MNLRALSAASVGTLCVLGMAQLLFAQPGPGQEGGAVSADGGVSGTDAGTSTTADAGAGDGGSVDANTEISTVDELRPPSSPAFTLLGISPTEVDRPRTPSALMTALGSAVGSSVPSSLALEFSPFWLFDQSRTTRQEFDRNKLMQIASSFAVNAATNKVEEDAALMLPGRTDLSVGASMVLYREWDDEVCKAIGTGPQFQDAAFLEAKKPLQKTFIESLKKCADQTCIDAAQAIYDQGIAALDELRLKEQTAVVDEWSKKLAKCGKAFWTPSGFVVSGAFATGWTFADSKWSESSYLRSAAWLTAGHEGKRFTGLGLGRVQWTNVGNDGASPDLVDVGGRLVIHRTSFAASVEGVKRFGLASGLPDGYRLALIGEGKLGGSWLSVSLGKDYDSTQDGSFFTLANLQVTMGDPQLAKEDKKKDDE